MNNVKEWDGRIIKAREQEIKDAALVLAGQCVAILLYNLSQSQEALDTAMIQTQGYWELETRKHGYRSRQILTVGNVLITLLLPYVTIRKNKSSGEEKKESKHQGFCPFLKWLGMEEGVTPLVWSTIAKYGAIASSFEAACTMLIDWGINISVKRIESLIRQVVNLRIKGNSKFWLKSNAEIMLHLRCQWMAGNWDNFCDSILTSFINPKVA